LLAASLALAGGFAPEGGLVLVPVAEAVSAAGSVFGGGAVLSQVMSTARKTPNASALSTPRRMPSTRALVRWSVGIRIKSLGKKARARIAIPIGASHQPQIGLLEISELARAAKTASKIRMPVKSAATS
jgi:hypothetical protein